MRSIIVSAIAVCSVLHESKAETFQGNGFSLVPYFNKFFDPNHIDQTNNFQSVQVNNTFELPLDMRAGIIPFRIGSLSNTIHLKPILTLDMTVISAKNCSNCPVKNFDSIQSDRDGSLKPTGKLYRNHTIELAIENSNYSMVVNGSSVTDTLCISTSNFTILNQC